MESRVKNQNSMKSCKCQVIISGNRNSMNGIKFQIQKLSQEITHLLIKPAQQPSQHLFDINYYSFSHKILHAAQMLLDCLEMDPHTRSQFKKLVAKMKEAARCRPEEESDDELEIGKKDEITDFLNARKPIMETKDRGDLYKFLVMREEKEKDHETFLQNISKVKTMPAHKQKINKVDTKSEATQTEITMGKNGDWILNQQTNRLQNGPILSMETNIDMAPEQVNFLQIKEGKESQRKDRMKKKLDKTIEGKKNNKKVVGQQKQSGYANQLKSELKKSTLSKKSLLNSKKSLSKFKAKKSDQTWNNGYEGCLYETKQNFLKQSQQELGDQAMTQDQKGFWQDKVNEAQRNSETDAQGQNLSGSSQERKLKSNNEPDNTRQKINQSDAQTKQERQTDQLNRKWDYKNSPLKQRTWRRKGLGEGLRLDDLSISKRYHSNEEAVKSGGQAGITQSKMTRKAQQLESRERAKMMVNSTDACPSVIYQEEEFDGEQQGAEGKWISSHAKISFGRNDSQITFDDKDGPATKHKGLHESQAGNRNGSDTEQRARNKENLPIIAHLRTKQKSGSLIMDRRKVGRQLGGLNNSYHSGSNRAERTQEANSSYQQPSSQPAEELRELKEKVEGVLKKPTFSKEEARDNEREILQKLESMARESAKSPEGLVVLSKEGSAQVRQCIRLMEAIHSRVCGDTCRHLERFYSMVRVFKMAGKKELKLAKYNVTNDSVL